MQNISSNENAFSSFTLPKKVNVTSGRHLMLNTILPFKITNQPTEKMIMLGYDDIYSVQFFHENLKAWWKHQPSATIEGELAKAAADYKKIISKCEVFDKTMYEDAKKADRKSTRLNSSHITI